MCCFCCLSSKAVTLEITVFVCGKFGEDECKSCLAVGSNFLCFCWLELFCCFTICCFWLAKKKGLLEIPPKKLFPAKTFFCLILSNCSRMWCLGAGCGNSAIEEDGEGVDDCFCEDILAISSQIFILRGWNCCFSLFLFSEAIVGKRPQFCWILFALFKLSESNSNVEDVFSSRFCSIWGLL